MKSPLIPDGLQRPPQRSGDGRVGIVLAVLAWVPILVTALSTLVPTPEDRGCLDICITIPLWAVLIVPASLVSAGLALAGLYRSRDARFGRYLSLSAFVVVGLTWIILLGHGFN